MPKTKSDSFEQKLKAVIVAGNRLSRAASVEELCRQVVELGRRELDFDRISIWFIDSSPDYITGSFGIDEKGKLRYEHGHRVQIASDPVLLGLHTSKGMSVLKEGAELRDHAGNPVGKGVHIFAAIWDGEEVVGYVSADNLLAGRPLTVRDQEILELYASTFGHLYSLKKAEGALRDAYARMREIQDELSTCQRYRIGGEVASGVVHEVKNPLSIIRRNIEYLREKVGAGDERVAGIFRSMNDAVLRVDRTITGLLDFSKLTKLDRVAVPLAEIVESALSLVEHQITKYGIVVEKQYGQGLPELNLDRNKMEQAVANLLLNAVYSMTGGGTLSVTIAAASGDKAGMAIALTIADTGTGIRADAIDKVFEPFFSTRKERGGTGMGLAVVKNMVELHGGRVRLENRTDRTGAVAKIVLPA